MEGGKPDALLPRLLEWYRTDPDPGIHGAIDWLLRPDRRGPEPRKFAWGQGEALRALDVELGKLPPVDRRWTVSSSGQTFTILPGPIEFTMGSPPFEAGRNRATEVLHRRRIPRSLAVATKKVTVAQFRRFLNDVQVRYPGVVTHTYLPRYSPDDDGPIVGVNWYDAAMYCRWLSELEGVPEEQMCYPPILEIKPGVALPANYLSRTGYRMPTPAEWEYACRAGTATSRPFGDSEELLREYAWYVQNSNDRAWPVGQLKPNDLGLFDMLGNGFEHCNSNGLRGDGRQTGRRPRRRAFRSAYDRLFLLAEWGVLLYCVAQRAAASVSNLESRA